MQSSIFRKVALDRLSSPEQLDQLIDVTPRRSWIALCSMGAALLLAVIWAFFGRLSVKVEGVGAPLREGAFDVVALGPGQVVELSVREGDLVNPGDVLAKLALPELDRRIRSLKALLGELESLAGDSRDQPAENRSQVEGARRQLRELEMQVADESRIVAPAKGRIAVIRSHPGDYVAIGEQVMVVEPAEEPKVVVFVPAAEAYRLEIGQKVELSPRFGRRSASGALEARIASISEQAISQATLRRLLPGDQLPVSAEAGPVVRVDVAGLRKQIRSQGSFSDIQGGELYSAWIIIKEESPVAFVMPLLRKKSGW